MIELGEVFDGAIAYLGPTALRGAVLMAGALVAGLLLRRASGLARHSLWTASIVGLLLLPVVQEITPRVPLAPAGRSGAQEIAARRSDFGTGLRGGGLGAADSPARSVAAGEPGDGDGSAAVGGPSRRSEMAPNPGKPATVRGRTDSALSAVGLGRLLLVVWLGGTAAMLGALTLGLGRARALRRRAARGAGVDWIAALDAARAEAGVRRKVDLHISSEVRTPMTGGVWRPFILLPVGARSWPAECRDVVLLHELIHVRRADAFRQLLGRLALAVHWFNPLVWIGVRMAAHAREEACDEAVLAGGCRPSRYARHLLELADQRPAPIPALSLARSGLERRILNILRAEGAAPRHRTGIGGALLGLACVLLAGGTAPADPEIAAPAAAADGELGGWPQRGVGVEADPAESLRLSIERPTRAGDDQGRSASRAEPVPEMFERGAAVLQPARRPGDPEDACVAVDLQSGFSSVARAGERTTVRRLGATWICAWTSGFESGATGLSLEAMPVGSIVVLASLGEGPTRRLEIRRDRFVVGGAATIDGVGQRWLVDGVERPFDEAARAWREAMLTLADGYFAMDRIRGGEARLLAEVARVRAGDARLLGQIAQLRAETTDAQATEAAGTADLARLQMEILRLRSVEAQRGLDLLREVSAGAELEGSIRILTMAIEALRQALPGIEDAGFRERQAEQIRGLQELLREHQTRAGAADPGRRAEAIARLQERERDTVLRVAELEAEIAARRAGAAEAIAAQRAAERADAVARIRDLEAERSAAAAGNSVEQIERRIAELESAERIREIEERLEEAARRIEEFDRP